MQTIPPYTNKHGETFRIALEYPSVPPDADYWGYYYVVTDSKDRKRAFRLVIKKTCISEEQIADGFAHQQPLHTLHGLLDDTVDGRLPLFLPDLGKGWEVY